MEKYMSLLRDINKILIFGDSIVYGKWDSEGGWAARLRRYIDEKYNFNDDKNIQVYNFGIPGEVARRMVKRVESELIFCKTEPHDRFLVIFAVGANDSCPNNWMTKQQTTESDFKSSLRKLIGIGKKHQCRIVFVGLTPVNPAKSKGLLFTNEQVSRYDRYISEICVENKIKRLDLFRSLMKLNFPEVLIDAVHPDSSGHKILAERIVNFLES
ncbi:hypothetical protein A3H03_01055 [Candidatus Kuenenbacteria bacterium RIFCSPLOWO2_12_FULL_42_13]|uniref:SGNH hydrolase-type esterase domain-containing protein n=1 Tax=Candidatus Kuenenbacteria bacterium RIFCSPLOWO2_12_FULL_42_13 TaxID=1798565 RepID=A0A1F6G1G4_9BACT|nr:MAG: hypothetical protein A3H03_01055 [Candidatus Kuenenbacteria bacterium RIFCSPLOWO2_12_FULL_42_13]